jgi:hypothetical protein
MPQWRIAAMSDEQKFVEGENFQDWFEKNEDQIHEMMRNDPYELLWEAWFAGYSDGLDKMAEMARPLWPTDINLPKDIDTSKDKA